MCYTVDAKGNLLFGPAIYPGRRCFRCGEDCNNPSQSPEEWLKSHWLKKLD